MKVNITKERETQMLVNLLDLHKKMCGGDYSISDVLKLTRIIQKKLEKRGEEIIDLISESNSDRS